jgi:hypothetical protein
MEEKEEKTAELEGLEGELRAVAKSVKNKTWENGAKGESREI